MTDHPMFLVIDSKQKGMCFDCDEHRRIYGVQRVLTVGVVKIDADLPPLPEGMSWQPTCKECSEMHQE